MAYGNHTIGGAPLGSTSDPSVLREQPETFRVIRDNTTVEDSVFDVDPLVDTANPYGDFCVIKMDDSGGEKFELYPRGTRVDVEIARSATSVNERFTGYVVERRETEQSGADVLEVEAYSFDQFLRRNTVSNSQEGRTITEALQNIVETDTPVAWNASNINVGDDQELTRGYQGTKVENVLRDLAFKSNNEEFGVNDSLEFFFRPRETTHIDRGIDNTQWFNYDIPELGKQAINEVEVWFNGGDESVIVDDSTDKLDLQDSLDLVDPGTQREELNRPLIQDISDAEDIGRKYLQFRNSTLSGTITTYGLYDAEPGDTIDIVIEPRGIDDEFVIAATEYRWGRDQTILTIIEKRGEQDGILTELNDSVQRVEMNGADRDAPKNRITTTQANALVDVSVDADGNTPTGTRFVNDGRRAVRDGWADISYPTIQNIVVGDDGGGLSRSNTSLNNEVASVGVSETLPDSKRVEYSASITEAGVAELGLETDDGTLLARVVFDTPVDLAGTVTFTLTVSNDDSVSRGVLTNDGQEAIRDVLADNSPNIPLDYGYGSDGSAVAESQTALGNEVVTVPLDEVLVQSADSQSEWQTITNIAADVPLTARGDGTLGVEQVCWTIEGENPDNSNLTDTESNGNYSNGVAIEPLDFVEYEFTPQHDIPAEHVALQIRDHIPNSSTATLNWILNGVTVDTVPSGVGPIALTWKSIGFWQGGGTYADQGGSDLQAGQTYTLRIEGDGSESNYFVDVVAPYDARYESGLTFDNDNGGSSGYLDGPELYPGLVETSLSTASTRRNTTEARFSLSANDVSNQFYVELANDGSTFTRVSNSETGTVTFASPDDGIDTNIGLSRYGSRTTATPQQGFQGQAIDVWNLYASVQAVTSDDIQETLARGIVPPNTIAGETIRECGLKNGSTLLSRHELAEFTLLQDQRLASSETSSFTGSD